MAAAPVLNQLNLVVRDMDATVAFLRVLGLDIPEAGIWRSASGAHHVDVQMPGGISLDLDSDALASHYDAGWQPSERAGRCVIGFSVTSREAVDARYAAVIAAGHPGAQPPYDAFWGARYAVVVDPDGNHFGIMSPIDEAKRGAPPSL